MSQWCRLWEDMPNDPKWRVVARRSGRPVSEVVAVFVHMMTNAANAPERGMLSGWSDEDVAIAIDADTLHVSAIRDAMQGKTLDGDRLTGWENRQSKREDGSAERAKAWRERLKEEESQRSQSETANAPERMQTHPNGGERNRTPEEKREDIDTSLRSVSCPKPAAPDRTRPRYPEDFEAFWSAFPTDANMSKKDAGAAWTKLSKDDRASALAAIPGFRAYCRKRPDYRPVHAVKFLTSRRFDGFSAQAGEHSKSDPVIDFRNGYTAPESTVASVIRQGRWDKNWGEPPGTPGCLVPRHLWPDEALRMAS